VDRAEQRAFDLGLMATVFDPPGRPHLGVELFGKAPGLGSSPGSMPRQTRASPSSGSASVRKNTWAKNVCKGRSHPTAATTTWGFVALGRRLCRLIRPFSSSYGAHAAPRPSALLMAWSAADAARRAPARRNKLRASRRRSTAIAMAWPCSGVAGVMWRMAALPSCRATSLALPVSLPLRHEPWLSRRPGP
jgi:hypothetical protein